MINPALRASQNLNQFFTKLYIFQAAVFIQKQINIILKNFFKKISNLQTSMAMR